MSVVVLGRQGQLARHLQTALDDAVFLGRDALDISEWHAIGTHLRHLQPSCIVNAAAYTAVDAAEDDTETAYRINAIAAGEVAAIAERLRVPLLHVSTDYVFDGRLDRPYREDDATNPQNVYGMSKLAGERAVQSRCQQHWILRTSWVFSEYGNNFVKTMLRIGAERDEVRVVADQVGRPTYAGDLAALIARLVESSDPGLPWGLYHVSGGRAASWADFAEAVFARARETGSIPKPPRVTRITTAEYPTPAVRPANTVMDAARLEAHLPGASGDWEAGLRNVTEVLAASRPNQAS